MNVKLDKIIKMTKPMVKRQAKRNVRNTVRKNTKGPKQKLILIAAVVAISLLGLGADKLGIITLPEELRVFSTEDTSYSKVAQNAEIQELIESVEVANPDFQDYDRKQFESPVRKFDGKSIRNYSLSISPDNISENDVFRYIDPFTGEPVLDTAMIDYDHIIPLHYVHTQVGDSWTDEVRNEYSFNIKNGVNTHRSENRGKGSKGPSEWLPPINQEAYVYSWLVIASDYDIPLRVEDMNVIKKILNEVDNVGIINIYE